MLDRNGKAALKAAIVGLREGHAGAWQALAPLSQLSAAGVEISIDFTTEESLGAPIIITRERHLRLPEGLTNRQQEVAKVLACGLSNKAIARMLGISPATVRDHIRQILTILGVSRKSEAVAVLHGSNLPRDSGTVHPL